MRGNFTPHNYYCLFIHIFSIKDVSKIGLPQILTYTNIFARKIKIIIRKLYFSPLIINHFQIHIGEFVARLQALQYEIHRKQHDALEWK